jgi:SMP-30/Gluconolactonase/LRE-like region
MLVTADNQTLIVAESYANNLTAFDIEGDGSLSNRRVWAALGEGVPDGICLDDEDAVWYGDVPNKRCVRVREGGEVLQTIELEQRRDTREADRSYAKSDPRHARRADAHGRARKLLCSRTPLGDTLIAGSSPAASRFSARLVSSRSESLVTVESACESRRSRYGPQ